MGQAVGKTLRTNGVTVRTCLDGRSARTRGLAAAAGVEDVRSLADLLMASEVFLSIVPPAQAKTLAEEVAPAMRATGARPLYVDCNAVAAQTLGIFEVLGREIADSQHEQRAVMERALPRAPTVAHRWIGEMEEIAKTFADLGLTPRLLEGAADMYRFAASSPLAEERPERRDLSRTMTDTIDELAEHLASPPLDPRD